MYGLSSRLKNAPYRLPPVFSEQDRAGNMLAMLTTNEFLDPVRAAHVRSSPQAPNGYIAGVGVGNVFAMMDLFPEGRSPRGIICTDVMPEVVLLGRAFVRSIAKSASMEETFDRLHGIDSLPVYLSVLRDEKHPEVRRRLLSAVPRVIEWMAERSDYSRLVSLPNIPGAVLKTIKRHFPALKRLAAEDNLAVTYASFTDPAWARYLKSLAYWGKFRNVIYPSNIVDHLTGRGKHMDKAGELNAVLADLKGGDEVNWFVDTTDTSLAYHLRISQDPPAYGPEDFA